VRAFSGGCFDDLVKSKHSMTRCGECGEGVSTSQRGVHLANLGGPMRKEF
jgi:hypothetical protein